MDSFDETWKPDQNFTRERHVRLWRYNDSLDHACRQALIHEVCVTGNMDTLPEMWEQYMNQRCNCNERPLYIATRNNQPEVVCKFIAAGASVNPPVYDSYAAQKHPNVKCHRGQPILLAADLGYHAILEHIVAAGANTSIVNKDRDTPLSLGVKAGDLRTVQILLQAGATVNCTNWMGYSPLGLALNLSHRHKSRYDIMHTLLRHKADPNWGAHHPWKWMRPEHFDAEFPTMRLFVAYGGYLGHLMAGAVKDRNYRLIELIMMSAHYEYRPYDFFCMNKSHADVLDFIRTPLPLQVMCTYYILFMHLREDNLK